MNDITPRPCPFCGGEVTVTPGETICVIRCPTCDIQMLDDRTTLAKWNRRIPDGQKILDFLYRLRDAMEEKKRVNIRYSLDYKGLNHALKLIEDYHRKMAEPPK